MKKVFLSFQDFKKTGKDVKDLHTITKKWGYGDEFKGVPGRIYKWKNPNWGNREHMVWMAYDEENGLWWTTIYDDEFTAKKYAGLEKELYSFAEDNELV